MRPISTLSNVLAIAVLLVCAEFCLADEQKLTPPTECPPPSGACERSGENPHVQLFFKVVKWTFKLAGPRDNATEPLPPPPACSPCCPVGMAFPVSQAPHAGMNNTVTYCTSIDSRPAEDAQVQELIKILNETKSPMTLVATTVALVPLGDKAKVAVPVILRNAERLKMLDSLTDPQSKKGEVASMLMDAVVAIQSRGTPERGANPSQSIRAGTPGFQIVPTSGPMAPPVVYPSPVPGCQPLGSFQSMMPPAMGPSVPPVSILSGPSRR